MEKTSKNGAQTAPAKNETPANGAGKTDTLKGVSAIAVAKVEPQPESPLQIRLKRIVEMQKLSAKRKNLVDIQDKVNTFEEDLTGEDDMISLGYGKNSLDIVKPDAVKEVVELLKNNVRQAIAQVDHELLTATI